MPLEIRADIPEGLEHGDVVLSEEINKGLRDASLTVEGAAKSLAPMMTGNLKRTIVSAVVPLGGTPTGIVAAQAGYAPYVEYGTRPHKPPFEPIRRWASANGANPWAIWNAIAKRGTRPHPFMEPAAEASRDSVLERLQKAMDAVLKRMSE